jgi:hypothetical protein
MKKINNAITVLAICAGLFAQTFTVFAQEYGDWSTTYPTYDTGSWSTTYPTYDTGSWSTTYPTYDTGSWSTTYPTYDTGSWSTTYPTYDTGSTYPTYDTGTTGTVNYQPVTYGTVDYGTVNYGSTNYGTTNYGTGWTGYTTVPVTGTVIGSYVPTYTTPTYTTIPVTTTTVCADGLPPVNGTCVRTTTIPVTTTTVCADGLPRNANGTCTRTTTVPVTTNTVCADGLPPVNGTCVRTTTIPVTTNTVCADGLPPVNGSCIRTNTIPVTTNTVCADGLPPVNGTCVRTNTIPTITNTVCSDGLPPFNGSCIRTNTIPTQTNIICSDGSYPVNGSCTHIITQPSMNYQTCWDGTTIPLNSVCPSQYKICANGMSIPVNQTCYYGNTYVPYTPPVTVKFNNVITSVTTEITNVSARCNGIGLIASNAPSTGWFEYGETPNLGRETAHAAIGSSPTAPFSNKLVNLKPSTTYYCRAIMQNQYGTVKGETVAFTTKATAVAYVKPVTKTTAKTTVTKTKSATTKNTLECVDGQVVSVASKSAVDLIGNGQKLVSLQIEKISGTLAPGASVIYRLTVKNISDEKLPGTMVKVTIPAEFELTNASAGTYDPTMHVLTIPNVPLSAYGEATINWTGKVTGTAEAGKSVVTTAYANYAVPGSQAQDEVSAYVVGSIVPSTGLATSTGSKTVVGASNGGSFLPNSLVEWLALIAILFIIFILGRSVYTSYQSEKVIVRH